VPAAGSLEVAMRKWFTFCVAAAFVFIPSAAVANCGDNECAVGALGQGGESSGGKARGFHHEFPSRFFDGETFTNVGNDTSGRGSISNVGAQSGTFHGDTARGHATGVFGDWSGQCEIEHLPECE
jgi:hypothetical protein